MNSPVGEKPEETHEIGGHGQQSQESVGIERTQSYTQDDNPKSTEAKPLDKSDENESARTSPPPEVKAPTEAAPLKRAESTVSDRFDRFAKKWGQRIAATEAAAKAAAKAAAAKYKSPSLTK